LEIVAIKLANGRESIDDYIQKTLLSHTADKEAIQGHVESSLNDLSRLGFIHVDESTYAATKLGKAVVASALEPEDGAFVHRELQRALQAFVMDGEMHILYTFTPVHDFSVTVNWQVFRNEMGGLDDSGLRVMTFLGLKPTIVNKMSANSTCRERSKMMANDQQGPRWQDERVYAGGKGDVADLYSILPGSTVARLVQRDPDTRSRSQIRRAARNRTELGADMSRICGRNDQVLRAYGLGVCSHRVSGHRDSSRGSR
jgi:hypothetical protein